MRKIYEKDGYRTNESRFNHITLGMESLNIKLLSDNATTPTRAYGVSAGLDIYAAETVVIEPQEKILLATDIAVDIPEGYVGLLTSRSGVSSKTHLVVETGKVDAGYNGHMKINVKNDEETLATDEYIYKDIKGESNDNKNTTNILEVLKELNKNTSYVIKKGEKIAQLVIVPIVTPEVNVVEEFDGKSERGSQGFGSSGY